jgi:hypothetical protein
MELLVLNAKLHIQDVFCVIVQTAYNVNQVFILVEELVTLAIRLDVKYAHKQIQQTNVYLATLSTI